MPTRPLNIQWCEVRFEFKEGPSGRFQRQVALPCHGVSNDHTEQAPWSSQLGFTMVLARIDLQNPSFFGQL